MLVVLVGLCLTTPLQSANSDTLSLTKERSKWSQSAQEREATALEADVLGRLEKKANPSLMESVVTRAHQLQSIVANAYQSAKSIASHVADSLNTGFKNADTHRLTDFEQQVDPQADIPSGTSEDQPKPHHHHHHKAPHDARDLEKSPASDLAVPIFRRYQCANESCSDQCYQKVVSHIMNAPSGPASATSNWVMCEFLSADSNSDTDCGVNFPEDLSSRYQRGRIEADTGHGTDVIAALEKWIDVLRQNCKLRPIISMVTVNMASTQFVFVVETRRDCLSRIYQSSPNNTYGLRTWLKSPEQSLDILDLNPFASRILHAARRKVNEEVKKHTTEAKLFLDSMEPAVVESITTARKKFGSGQPLSLEAFTDYILHLKDAYLVFCDDLHGAHRTWWQSMARTVSCGFGESRTKPRASHLMTEIFGESIDRCSPSLCSFAYDTFAYDDVACGADLKKLSQMKAAQATHSKQSMAETQLPVQWLTEGEDSPFAEDEDPPDWQFQDPRVTVQRYVASSFALTQRAITYMKDQALGLTSPRSWNIRELGSEMDYDNRDKMTKQWQKEAAEQITSGKIGKRSRKLYDPTKSDPIASIAEESPSIERIIENGLNAVDDAKDNDRKGGSTQSTQSIQSVRESPVDDVARNPKVSTKTTSSSASSAKKEAKIGQGDRKEERRQTTEAVTAKDVATSSATGNADVED